MKTPHSIERFPVSRLSTFDVGVVGRSKHRITGLLEIDVTMLRSRLRELRRRGAPVSFFACFIQIVATTIREVPQVHGVLRGRRRIIFEDVDVAVVLEREIDGQLVPVPMVIRSANARSIHEIDAQIREGKDQPIRGKSDYELGRRRSNLMTALYYRLPQFLRVTVLRRLLRNPFVRKANMGTVMITSLGSFHRVPGWMLPQTMHNLAFGVGSIVRKPRVVGEDVVPRDVLHLTISFDHDVVDGVPAGRFAQALARRLENADALAQV
jgi:pyruvate/2-oxoglutarate dehydrogenase complex dihydrolipoamide acyltransferase (E2) component